jgi:hypothetical protein
MLDRYIDQVRLLVDVLPHIAKEEAFALKGGTAINLFYRDMPRLSVDIDLTYVPVEDRDASLKHIDETLNRIMETITVAGRVQAQRIAGGGNNDTRIMVSDGTTRIKIETSPVARGTVFPPQTMVACDAVMEQFGFAEMKVLAFEDLFGGKLHAALDRQHPRDLFDAKLLYENEGLTDDLFRVFMVYVASSGRPMHELLAPATPPPDGLFGAEFEGMTRDSVSKDELDETRVRLHADIKQRLTGDIATFLLSLHDAEPDFDLIGLPEAAQLPAIRWKLLNLEKFKRDNAAKHAAQREDLEKLFR